ncbi:hypothetical protein DXG01_003955 [Tephrocybe rancida]|nr:hypothetical protein DXG01_003955 [Tephrocybe rancida]
MNLSSPFSTPLSSPSSKLSSDGDTPTKPTQPSSPLTEPSSDSDLDSGPLPSLDIRLGLVPPNPPAPLNDPSAFPPLSDDGIVVSSPVRTKEDALRKRHKQQREKAALDKKEREAPEIEHKRVQLDEVIDFLHSKNLRFLDLMEHVFDPTRYQGNVRWHEFFVNRGAATKVLNWWTSSSNSKPAQEEVGNWAIDYVANKVAREAQEVTQSGELRTMRKTIDESFITSFSFSTIHTMLSKMAAVSMRLLTSFSTSPYAEEHTSQRKARTITVVTSSALACLGEYSHSNNIAKRILGLYLYATGAQRQAIAVMSKLGLSESYTNIVSRKAYKKKTKAPSSIETPTIGVPPSVTTNAPTAAVKATELSGSMRSMARAIAATGLYGIVYDNINIFFRNAEQIIGRHDSQENGTCATLFRLWATRLEDLELKKFQEAFLTASPLNITDILHTPTEARDFRLNLIFTLMRVAVTHGGEGFEKFEKQLEEEQPVSPLKIKVHQTDLHPLPAWNIDESTIIGNSEVDDAIVEELRLRDEGRDEGSEFPQHVRVMSGDQLSLARLRALENIQAGNEAGHPGFFWGAWMPGLFHGKIADIHGLLSTHWGSPRNPGSLAFHNTRLDRLPITLTSLPPFRTCRDLVFVSLYARVLHCFLSVSGYKTLEEYTTKVKDWKDFKAHAEQVYDKFVNTKVVDDLRQQRAACSPDGPITTGDMVFENGVLFLRDALISREYSDAIKSGDSGRVLLVLKTWALSFRGSGRTKYAYEMLHIIHNLTSVWPKPVRDIILNNWLLNPTGKPNSFVEVDLVQEHLNFWIKSYYKAHGSNASWEWLEQVAPCVTALRNLANGLNHMFGDDQGTWHAPPDLTEDIESLMSSLEEYKVYHVVQGRVLEDNEQPTVDIISFGLSNMMDNSKSPLTEYIKNFTSLQNQRRKTPIIIPSSSTTPSNSNSVSGTPSMPNPDPIQLAQPQPTSDTPSYLQPIGTAVNGASGDVEPDDESDYGGNEDMTTELAQILNDIENGYIEPTLTRDEAEDVSLDMDMVYHNDDVECSDASGDEETGDEGDDDLVF